MWLKSNKGDRVFIGLFLEKFKIILKSRLILYAVFFLFWSLIMIGAGAIIHKAGFIGYVLVPALRENFRIPLNLARGLLANPERIQINISFKNYQKLEYKRSVALSKGVLITDDSDYVNATVIYQGEGIPVRLRLKGDHIDHLRTKKWSFRVMVTNNKTLFGMKRFSLHHPRTRNYIYEWLFHKALSLEGIISLRYKFINVVLNGKDLGIYALEEHFTKHLIEYNRRREGPIIRFSEDTMWRDGVQSSTFLESFFSDEERMLNESGSYLSSVIDAFQTNKTISDKTLFEEFKKAAGLLNAFRRGKMPTHKVFDVDQLATFFALTNLMGAEHGARWNNARFYYNPITSHLEPIGFDAFSQENFNYQGISKVIGANRILKLNNNKKINLSDFYDTLFSDPVFFERYVSELQRISNPDYLDSFLSKVSSEMSQNQNIIFKGFPYAHFSKQIFYRNQNYFRYVLNPVNPISIYLQDKEITGNRTHVILSMTNTQSMPLEIIGISFPNGLNVYPKEKTIIQAKQFMEPVQYHNVIFDVNEDISSFEAINWKVNYRLLGTSNLRSAGIFPWPNPTGEESMRDIFRNEPNMKKFICLELDEFKKKIKLVHSQCNIDKTLVIPEGYVFHCPAGVKIDLTNGATILSGSPLYFIGEEDNAITITSSDSRGGGIIVLRAGGESKLESVVFAGLSNPKQNEWELTGAITFYESPVRINRCIFKENKSEDGLNIIRSKFQISNSTFADSLSDALDIDFGEGSIEGTFFTNSGNDAMDLSASDVSIYNVMVSKSQDKGISVGEDSKITAHKIQVSDSTIGIASKDKSCVDLEDVRIKNCRIGLAVYQKKPEFGPGFLKVKNIQIDKTDTHYQIEENSNLILDGKRIKANAEKLATALYN